MAGAVHASSPPVPITVVVMTRDRAAELVRTLGRLARLPEAPPVVVVDNGSSDDTSPRVRAEFPGVDLVRLEENAGVEARNVGAERSRTPYVAFCDDDSAWTPGSLRTAVAAFERHPSVGAVTAHIRVQPGGRDDPVSLAMRDSPLADRPGLPGIPVLGFLACATAVRREAFLAAGPFETRLHFGGEEALLAVDLAAAGWDVRYLPDAVVEHHASSARDRRWRRRRDVRNALWLLWLRRPAAVAARRSVELLRGEPASVAAPALAEALALGAWVPGGRRVVPSWLETELRRLEAPAPARGAAA